MSLHWEDLDHHLRHIVSPWNGLEFADDSALLGEVCLRQAAAFPDASLLKLQRSLTSDSARRLLRLVLFLLCHERFLQIPRWTEGLQRLLTSVGELGAQVSASLFLSDSERREELIRRVIEAMGLAIEGESEQQSQERRDSLDSLARARILQETRATQARVRAIREALAKKEAEEAASKYTRE